jgi:hypothetical protein
VGKKEQWFSRENLQIKQQPLYSNNFLLKTVFRPNFRQPIAPIHEYAAKVIVRVK